MRAREHREEALGDVSQPGVATPPHPLRTVGRMLSRRVLPALMAHQCPGCGQMRCEPCAYCQALLLGLPRAAAPEGILALRGYEGVVRDLLTGVKYRRGLPAVAVLAQAFDELRYEAGVLDVVTWAPTSVRRRRERGFDQAEQLARAVARRWRLPVRSLLARDDSPTQTGRSRSERLVGPGFRSRSLGGGPRVLVLDDVVTTGTTLRAAADALRGAGAGSVTCAAWAATPLPTTLARAGRPVPPAPGR